MIKIVSSAIKQHALKTKEEGAGSRRRTKDRDHNPSQGYI